MVVFIFVKVERAEVDAFSKVGHFFKTITHQLIQNLQITN